MARRLSKKEAAREEPLGPRALVSRTPPRDHLAI